MMARRDEVVLLRGPYGLHVAGIVEQVLPTGVAVWLLAEPGTFPTVVCALWEPRRRLEVLSGWQILPDEALKACVHHRAVVRRWVEVVEGWRRDLHMGPRPDVSEAIEEVLRRLDEHDDLIADLTATVEEGCA